MANQSYLHKDLLAMNLSWLQKELELFGNQNNIFVSTICTIAIITTFVMAIFVHRAFYKLMGRLPDRDVNQIIFPYMVKLSQIEALFLCHMKINSQNDFTSKTAKINHVRSNSTFQIKFVQHDFIFL